MCLIQWSTATMNLGQLFDFSFQQRAHDDALEFYDRRGSLTVLTFDALSHTQLDVNAGLTLGGQVGQQVVARAQGDGAN